MINSILRHYFRTKLLSLIFLSFSLSVSAQWSSPGGGVGGWVHATATYNGKLIAGGELGVNGNYIAAWNGSSWESLGSGVDGQVNALCVYNGELFAGGRFLNAGGVSAPFIARWNGVAWNEVSGGTNSTVSAMCVYNNELIVGGYFKSDLGGSKNFIARWNESDEWRSLGTGMGGTEGQVLALTTIGTKLYAGGFFTSAGGVSAPHIAEWNGTSWSCPGGVGINWIVYGLNNYNGKLVAGGLFTSSGGVPTYRVSQWDGANWSALGAGVGGGVYGYCFALQQIGPDLYAGGIFTNAGTGTAANLARWDGTTWYPVADYMGSGGTVQAIYCLSTYNGSLVAGGIFNYISGSGSSAGSANVAIFTPPNLCLAPAQPGTMVITGGVAKVCTGHSRTYTVPLQADATSYDWTIPNGANLVSGGGTRSITLNFTAGFPAFDTLRVSAVNACGISAQRKLRITRTTVATPGVITGSTAGLCGATSVSYSVPSVAGMVYSWTAPGGGIITGQGANTIVVDYPSVSFSGNVSVKASNSCWISAARNLAVKSVPATPASITGPITVCANSLSNAYSIAPISGASLYTWTGPTGSRVSDGITTSAKNILTTTSSSVSISFTTVTATSKISVKGTNGCGSGSTKSITLVPAACRMANGSEMEVIENPELQMFPNPNKGQFTLITPASNSGFNDLEIIDVLGKVVYSEKIQGWASQESHAISLSPLLQSGVYYLRIDQHSPKKLVIEK